MNALDLFEYLSTNAKPVGSIVEALLTEQDESFKDAFSSSDNEKLRVYLSGGAKQADKTTIFHV